jgi:MFS family permease
MHSPADLPLAKSTANGSPWWRTLNRYHWFVLTVAALGWLFDTMDQQLFVLARPPAMTQLLRSASGQPPSAQDVDEKGGYATSIFLVGWALGGLLFGILGDRIGRTKTMILTILSYSLFTGLSALSRGFWDFAFYRFLTGLGVGGQFAVGVALVAETMPVSARPFALGFLQALSAVGNITAALINVGIGGLESAEVIDHNHAWRYLFVIGTVPALLALLVFLRLKEPEAWKAAAAARSGNQQLGSVKELFGDFRWRKHALLGLVLASAGVIGLWGIGFFSADLNRHIFRKTFEEEARRQGEAALDRQFIRLLLQDPDRLERIQDDKDLRVRPEDLLSLRDDSQDARLVFRAMLAQRAKQETVTLTGTLATLSPQEREVIRSSGYLDGPAPTLTSTVAEHARRINSRAKEIAGRLTLWAGITSMMLNLGAFFGIYAFTYLTHFGGRRPAFALSFLLAMLSTALVFGYLDSLGQIFWMIPLMGFCQLALFGGYAIYFPELFPTRLRSTGTSFCYNVGRLMAAIGPTALGVLTKYVYPGWSEPMRPAGVTMCAIFLLGLVVLPFLPETRGKPLPE